MYAIIICIVAWRGVIVNSICGNALSIRTAVQAAVASSRVVNHPGLLEQLHKNNPYRPTPNGLCYSGLLPKKKKTIF